MHEDTTRRIADEAWRTFSIHAHKIGFFELGVTEKEVEAIFADALQQLNKLLPPDAKAETPPTLTPRSPQRAARAG